MSGDEWVHVVREEVRAFPLVGGTLRNSFLKPECLNANFFKNRPEVGLGRVKIKDLKLS